MNKFYLGNLSKWRICQNPIYVGRVESKMFGSISKAMRMFVTHVVTCILLSLVWLVMNFLKIITLLSLIISTKLSSISTSECLNGAIRSLIFLTAICEKYLEPVNDTKKEDPPLSRKEIYNEFSDLLESTSLKSTWRSGSPS